MVQFKGVHLKRYLLSTWHDFSKRRRIDNILFRPVFSFWERFEYLGEKDPDRREEMKGLAMGGNSGREWAKYYSSESLDFNSKIGELTFREAVPILNEIEAILGTAKNSLVVIQIGCSSGRWIAYFAGKHPAHTFIGTDVYKEVIDYATRIHKGNNLSFRILSATDIGQLLGENKDGDILIFSDGSLTYVQPEHMQAFFNSIVGCVSAMVLLNEPGNDRRVKPDELEGSMWRGNFSYTHNYKFYAEKAGIKTIKSEIIRPYIGRRSSTIHYFYYGKTNSCNW